MNGISPNSFFFFHNIWPARYKWENPPPNKPFYYVHLFSFIVFPHVLYAILLQQNEFYMLPFIYYTMKSPSLWYVVEYTKNCVIFAPCYFVQYFLLTKMQCKLPYIFHLKARSFLYFYENKIFWELLLIIIIYQF